MARQLWLADVLRAAGLTVHEVSGWRTRGDITFSPRGLIVHETRGPATSTDRGEINVMVNGREGLAGPIAHLYLSRTGDWHVVNSGRTSHVKTGWAGQFSGLGNSNLLGIEAQHAEAEDWTAKPVQYRSYVRGVAAICAHMGWRFGGHKEHQPGDKTDPEFDMDQFRRDVAAVRDGADDMAIDDRDFQALIWRVEAIIQNRQKVAGGPLAGEANALAARLAELATPTLTEEQLVKLADLIAARLPRPTVPPTPQEIAKAVLDEDHKRSAE